MSVKRLSLLDEFHGVISRRLKDLFKRLSHAEVENFRDIINNLDYSHRITKELLKKAKEFQKRDIEAKKK
jgi:hypothetical protein